MKQKILIVAAHPDDEVLGVGGTASRHANDGDTVETIILGEGITSRNDVGGQESLQELQASAKAAAKVLGINSPIILGFPDNRLDSLELLDLIKPIEDIIHRFSPDIVYTHHAGDLNIDHRITHAAVLTACRPTPESSVCRIYAFETVSSTEWVFGRSSEQFAPQRYVDVTQTLADKLSALACYDSEMRPFPHARSIEAVEALAKLRGSQVGFLNAEAFEVLLDKS